MSSELIGLVLLGAGAWLAYNQPRQSTVDPSPDRPKDEQIKPMPTPEPKPDPRNEGASDGSLDRMEAMASADKLVRYFESKQHASGVAAMRQVIVAVYETPKADSNSTKGA